MQRLMNRFGLRRRVSWQSRAKESLAMMMVGDGILATLEPVRHVALWQCGPKAWRRAASALERRPGLMRVTGLAAVSAGLWLATRQRA